MDSDDDDIYPEHDAEVKMDDAEDGEEEGEEVEDDEEDVLSPSFSLHVSELTMFAGRRRLHNRPVRRSQTRPQIYATAIAIPIPLPTHRRITNPRPRRPSTTTFIYALTSRETRIPTSSLPHPPLLNNIPHRSTRHRLSAPAHLNPRPYLRQPRSPYDQQTNPEYRLRHRLLLRILKTVAKARRRYNRLFQLRIR
jgi:hypothetical protein